MAGGGGGLWLELKSWAHFLLPGNRYLATYYATPHSVVRELLAFARVGPGDVVLDLGAGDGRVVWRPFAISAPRARSASTMIRRP